MEIGVCLFQLVPIYIHVDDKAKSMRIKTCRKYVNVQCEYVSNAFGFSIVVWRKRKESDDRTETFLLVDKQPQYLLSGTVCSNLISD